MDDVRAQVQRAVKDLSIEQSLKTYDEVWLSKIFELRPHTRIRTEIDVAPTNQVHGMGVKKNPNLLMVSYFESYDLLIAKFDYLLKNKIVKRRKNKKYDSFAGRILECILTL